jgi:hypothetical protein
MDLNGMNKDCEAPEKTILLIQHLREPVTIGKVVNTKESFLVHVPSMLFQIYSVLHTLRDEFTHYDLHTGNVLLYEIPEDKYVTMVYHLPNGEGSVTFRTKYIAKIIDYGRCYFSSAKGGGVWSSSQEYYNALQEINTNTNRKCSDNRTYVSFGADNGSSHTDSKKRNQSHDLFFVKNIDFHIRTHKDMKREEIMKIVYTKFYKDIVDKVQYNERGGTPEINNSDYGTSGKIYNVTDMFHALKKYMEGEGEEGEKWIKSQKIFEDDKKLLGTMEIWLDRSSPIKLTFTSDDELSTLSRHRKQSF